MGRYLIDGELHDRLATDERVYGADGEPLQSHLSGYGKWGRTGTPWEGWGYAGGFEVAHYHDLIAPGMTLPDDRVLTPELFREPLYLRAGFQLPICEMCEKAPLIYVHKLAHDDYDRRLYCGRECAGHMTGDPLLVGLREKRAKYFHEAPLKCRAVWAVNDRGRHVATTWGFTMTVKPVGHGFQGEYRHHTSGYKRHSRAIYRTLDEAKRVTVNAMLKARFERPWQQAD